jgi:hypothetical protein
MRQDIEEVEDPRSMVPCRRVCDGRYETRNSSRYEPVRPGPEAARAPALTAAQTAAGVPRRPAILPATPAPGATRPRLPGPTNGFSHVEVWQTGLERLDGQVRVGGGRSDDRAAHSDEGFGASGRRSRSPGLVGRWPARQTRSLERIDHRNQLSQSRQPKDGLGVVLRHLPAADDSDRSSGCPSGREAGCHPWVGSGYGLNRRRVASKRRANRLLIVAVR